MNLDVGLDSQPGGIVLSCESSGMIELAPAITPLAAVLSTTLAKAAISRRGIASRHKAAQGGAARGMRTYTSRDRPGRPRMRWLPGLAAEGHRPCSQ